MHTGTLPVSGEVLGGRYRLEALVATGGMAAVWRATDQVLQREVAVKLPHAHLADDRERRERFRREAVLAAKLSHPGIVATYDAGVDGERPWIVMELVGGRTVRDLLDAHRHGVAPAVAVEIVRQAAVALAAAHRAGLVHRDVKPANLLVEDDADVGLRVKVADFGIARADSTAAEVVLGEVGDAGGLTPTVAFELDLTLGEGALEHTRLLEDPVTGKGRVLGTARYLAPEQVLGGPVDARTDVYGLGVVLFELLVGAPPFVRPTDVATALAHVGDPVPPLPHDPDRPRALDALVDRCLAKDAADRPATASEVAEALAALGSAGRIRLPFTSPGSAVQQSETTALDAPADAEMMATNRRSSAGERRRNGRSRMPFAMLCLLVGAAVLVTGLALFDREDPSPRSRIAAAPTTATAAPALRVSDVRSFDPPGRAGSMPGGDGAEGEDHVDRLLDGDLSTTWRSDAYSGPRFGGLKAGVGVVFSLASPVELHQLAVDARSQGWAASVFLADRPGATLAEWGTPVATRSRIGATTTLDLGGRRAGAVLLWITDPGPTNRIELAEVLLR